MVKKVDRQIRRVIFTKGEEGFGSGHSSKGNQLKWKDGDFWYKADHMGYEGLAEVAVSSVLEHSSLHNRITYEPVKILYKGREIAGCCSRNFLKEDEELITLEHLFRMYTGRSLAKILASIGGVKERISFVVEQTVVYTGLEEFGAYLTGMLEMDAFFLNEDRHTNNIAVIYNGKSGDFRLCPYFDMGLSLFSDTCSDFPMGSDLEECRKCIAAKPFSRDFDEQLDAANELYGSFLEFYRNSREIMNYLKEQTIFQSDLYEEPIKTRVMEVLRRQMRKYLYMLHE